MAIEASEFNLAVISGKTNSIKQKIINLQNLLNSLKDSMPFNAMKEIESLEETSYEMFAEFEKNVLQFKMTASNLRDKFVNFFHGALGSIDCIRSSLNKIQPLLTQYTYHVPEMTMNGIEMTLKELSNNMTDLEKVIKDNNQSFNKSHPVSSFFPNQRRNSDIEMSYSDSELPSGSPSVERKAKTKKKVLIVDDNKLNRKILASFLKDVYELDFAVDGKDAIKKHNEFRSDAILMDINMPEMDGIEATKEIRKSKQADGVTPVVILAVTANALDQALLDEINRAGMNGYLGKPFNKEKMIEKIENCRAPKNIYQPMKLK